jgi:hypothetical protein
MGQMGDGGYRSPHWSARLGLGCGILGCASKHVVCGVLYPALKGLYSSICRSWERVSLEVACTSSDRKVELIALGDAELGGAETFLNGFSEHDGKCQLSMQHMVCEG